jgi:isoleucyl-tRNA synthetase
MGKFKWALVKVQDMKTLLLIAATIALACGGAWAEMYKVVQPDGTILLTDTPSEDATVMEEQSGVTNVPEHLIKARDEFLEEIEAASEKEEKEHKKKARKEKARKEKESKEKAAAVDSPADKRRKMLEWFAEKQREEKERREREAAAQHRRTFEDMSKIKTLSPEQILEKSTKYKIEVERDGKREVIYEGMGPPPKDIVK